MPGTFLGKHNYWLDYVIWEGFFQLNTHEMTKCQRRALIFIPNILVYWTRALLRFYCLVWSLLSRSLFRIKLIEWHPAYITSKFRQSNLLLRRSSTNSMGRNFIRASLYISVNRCLNNFCWWKDTTEWSQQKVTNNGKSKKPNRAANLLNCKGNKVLTKVNVLWNWKERWIK